MSSSSSFVAVFVSAPRQVARELARHIVSQRLAACVSLTPTRSVYYWDGEVQEAEEETLMAKTTADRVDELTAEVKRVHPYSCPEIVALRASHPPLPSRCSCVCSSLTADDDDDDEVGQRSSRACRSTSIGSPHPRGPGLRCCRRRQRQRLQEHQRRRRRRRRAFLFLPHPSKTREPRESECRGS
jgi:periplasmic divalent cation tolerance protein